MAITTVDQYVAANKQRITWIKTAARTTIAAIPFSLFELAGNPGAGVLAGTSTAAGVVPTDATAGCPTINFSTGVGYLSKVEFGNTVAGRLHIVDLLWKAGAFAFNANVSGITGTNYLGRTPDGAGGGCEIWLETVTAFTGNISVTIGYTNQAGTAGRTTGAFSPAVAPTLGRMFQVPLQAGDTGVQSIQSVVATTATVGTFNVLVVRPLYTNMRMRLANDGDIHDMFKTGMPVVYLDSALFVISQPDSTGSGVPELQIEIANG